MSLMFCDQTSGKPSIRPVLAAAPAVTAAVFRKRLRPGEVCPFACFFEPLTPPFFTMVVSC
jgi:hypothetical protein